MTDVFNYDYSEPRSLKITKTLLRKTLADVRDQLLSRDINGGKRQLDMNRICDVNSCGTVACIGGWVSLFLLGFEGETAQQCSTADDLMSYLHRPDRDPDRRLYHLFYEYDVTVDHHEPNVAATAIQRYLNGKVPWPRGDMPNVLAYTKRAKAKK